MPGRASRSFPAPPAPVRRPPRSRPQLLRRLAHSLHEGRPRKRDRLHGYLPTKLRARCGGGPRLLKQRVKRLPLQQPTPKHNSPDQPRVGNICERICIE